jgi:heat shock protein HtpX
MTTYQHQASNTRKTIFIMFLMTTLVLIMGAGMSYIYKSPVYLLFGVVAALFQSLVSYYSGEKMALASAQAQRVDISSQPALYNMVEDLARIARIPTPDLYISPDPSPNAFACGRGPGRASIVVNQGIISLLNKQELEGVLAHEMSHVRNKDVMVTTMAFMMSAIVGTLADIGMRIPMPRNNSDDDVSETVNGLVVVLIFMSYIVAPILATMLVLFVSRSREYLADAGAVELTRYPQGLISALQKLEADPTPTNNYQTATNHFYISEPKRDYNQKFKDGWFSTHPSLENRIKNLLDQDGTLGK